MRQIWVVSDTHFGHANIIKHANRPFDSVEQMDEAIADNWNDAVGKDDLVYHLGDIAWTGAGLKLFGSLPGTKRLILGNHDEGKSVAPLVQKIYLFKKFRDRNIVMSHMPLDMTAERFLHMQNLHGHIHQNVPPTIRHTNCCVEFMGYRPVPFETFKGGQK